MDINRIKELAELLEEYGLTELEVDEKDARVYLSKAATVAPTAVAAPSAPVQSAAGVASVNNEEKSGDALESPLVGVAYLAPAPGEAPFVRVGDSVKKGQTMCILEAMKVMNEFPAPRDGVVLDICVGNEELVEFGQVLFRLG